MTNSQLTREKVQWLHDAAEEAAAVGIKLTMNPSELLMFTSSLLAAMDSEPVAYIEKQWTLVYYVPPMSIGLKIGDKLYRHAQPAPDNRAITQHFDTIALETAREILCDVNRRHEFLGGEVQLLSRIQCRIDDACRAAMLQTGNSPVIPDGYVMVPKEPTEAMMLHKSGCQHHAWDDPDCAMRQTRRLIWSHMLAAAPQEVK